MRVTIPYAPRDHFRAFHGRRQRFACIVAHRRAGKTVACINELIRGALRCERVEPRFAYVAPFQAQAKDVAWSYLKRFTAPVQGARASESELYVDLPNGGRTRHRPPDSSNHDGWRADKNRFPLHSPVRKPRHRIDPRHQDRHALRTCKNPRL